MNYRAGLLHGDLHLNNATLNHTLYKKPKEYESSSVLYIVGETLDDQFIFPTMSHNLCLIDFSRSIILPDRIEQYNDISLPKSYSIINKFKEFQEDQIDRLLQLYMHYTSDAHNIDDLRIIFRNKFEAVFKLLTTTDLYGFTHKLLAVFNINDMYVKPHSSTISFVKKINSMAYSYITEEMNKLITDPSYEGVVNDMDWPLYTIIKNCFSGFLVDRIEKITDVFNINNKLTFSLSKFDKFPNNITNPKDIVNGKEVATNNEFYVKMKKRREIFEKEKHENLKIVNYIAVRQKDKHV